MLVRSCQVSLAAISNPIDLGDTLPSPTGKINAEFLDGNAVSVPLPNSLCCLSGETCSVAYLPKVSQEIQVALTEDRAGHVVDDQEIVREDRFASRSVLEERRFVAADHDRRRCHLARAALVPCALDEVRRTLLGDRIRAPAMPEPQRVSRARLRGVEPSLSGAARAREDAVFRIASFSDGPARGGVGRSIRRAKSLSTGTAPLFVAASAGEQLPTRMPAAGSSLALRVSAALEVEERAGPHRRAPAA